jgi:hypothetical protein
MGEYATSTFHVSLGDIDFDTLMHGQSLQDSRQGCKSKLTQVQLSRLFSSKFSKVEFFY